MKILALAAVSITCGFAQSNDCHALEECQKALKTNGQSSLLHFRLGEIYLQRADYLQALNEFMASTAGDRNPRWVEVWAHIDLAKVRKMISQPEWAAAAEFREFKQALRTGDNTFGAQDEVVRLLKEIGVEVQPRILDPRVPKSVLRHRRTRNSREYRGNRLR